MRLQKTLFDIATVFGNDTMVYLGVELTKMHENNMRGSAKELLDTIDDHDA